VNGIVVGEFVEVSQEPNNFDVNSLAKAVECPGDNDLDKRVSSPGALFSPLTRTSGSSSAG
jgi:hypothetical protein